MSGIQGKVILITGASSGIGESTARVLAGKGARVVLGARRTDRLEKLVREIRDAGHEAHFRTLDVTSLKDVQAFTGLALETHGRIDVVVNNAGVMPLSKLEELKIDEWNRMIDVNIRGVLHGIAAALPLMKKQGHGQFVNVSSTAGHTVYATAGVGEHLRHGRSRSGERVSPCCDSCRCHRASYRFRHRTTRERGCQ